MGYSPWGGKGVRHDFLTKQQQAVQGQNVRNGRGGGSRGGLGPAGVASGLGRAPVSPMALFCPASLPACPCLPVPLTALACWGGLGHVGT